MLDVSKQMLDFVWQARSNVVFLTPSAAKKNDVGAASGAASASGAANGTNISTDPACTFAMRFPGESGGAFGNTSQRNRSFGSAEICLPCAQMNSFRLPACRQAEALFLFIALRAARAAASASAAALFAGADRMNDGADDRRGNEQQDNNVGGTHTSSLPTL